MKIFPVCRNPIAFFFWLVVIQFNFSATQTFAQAPGNDVTTPLHLLKPDYPVPYGVPSNQDITKILDKVFTYVDEVTPAAFINRKTNEAITDYNTIDTNTIVKPGDFRLTSYEWGVTYSALLLASQVTNNNKYQDYVIKRLNLLADAYPYFSALYKKYPRGSNPLRQPVSPHALDDGGAVCAAMIKALGAGAQSNLRVVIDQLLNYVAIKEYRLPDGTLARNRPQKNTLWLDDLYMGVPALAQGGKLTGDRKYFDDAVKQVLQYSARMFNKDKGLYMHGWVESMEVHPQFHWGRANGWAVLAMTELLDVLPENHPGRKAVLAQLKAHISGLVRYQSGSGFWHQLLDRHDSYLETSATAIYSYCIAHAVNNGWIDGKAFAPAAVLAWNAVSTKVNAKGQVEGTCVGTGMGFDPAFYYYRPVNVFAAHGYGPVIMAAAEMIRLNNKFVFEINDSSVQLKEGK